MLCTRSTYLNISQQPPGGSYFIFHKPFLVLLKSGPLHNVIQQLSLVKRSTNIVRVHIILGGHFIFMPLKVMLHKLIIMPIFIASCCVKIKTV